MCCNLFIVAFFKFYFTCVDSFKLTGQCQKIVRHCLQAFGVGAFENEDEDIYGIESMANYDTVLGDEPQAGERKNFGWTAPKHVSG